MNFKITRTLENKVFSTSVKFDAYGSADMDIDEEKALISDFGAAIIDLGAIKFTGKYSVDASKKIVADETAGTSISFIINSKKIEIKEGFEAIYSVDATKIAPIEITGSFTTKELVAEAKCILFETKIKEAMALIIAEFKKQRTQFEQSTQEFTI